MVPAPAEIPCEASHSKTRIVTPDPLKTYKHMER
jgi:hypothetical protein